MKKCINHRMLKRTFNIVSLIVIFSFLIANISLAEIVKKIEITGNNRIPNETIQMFGDINLNDDLSSNDINNIIKNLYETNFFKNIQIKFVDNNLKIIVQENPIISDIKITGLKAKKLQEEVKKVLTLREKSSFNEILLVEEKQKISNTLKGLGYVFSKVEFLVEDLDDNKLNLMIDIKLGDKAKISKITFTGNKIFKDKKLKSIITSEEYKFWKFLSGRKYLNQNMIKFDEQLLKNFYLNKGYFNVVINSSFAKIIEEQNFELIFNINAKNKVKFGDLELILPIDYSKENFNKIINNFKKLKGEAYSLNKIKNILDDIDEIVLSEQFESISASVEEEFDKDQINLKFIITESEKIFVERINIIGNDVTEESVIRNQLFLDEGDPYNEILTTKSINNIRSLRFFKTVNYEIVDGSDKDSKILNIKVEEKPTGEIMAGAGFGTSGSSLLFAVKENNFLGKGISLDTNLNLSTESVKGKFTIENNNYNNSDKSLFLSLDASETDRLKDSGYKFNKTGFEIGSRFEYLDDFFLKVGTSNYYEKLETDNTASKRQQAQEGDYFDSFFLIGAIYDKRNQKYQTSDGFLSSYYLDLPIISDNYTLVNSYRYKFFTELYENNVSTLSLSLNSAHSLKNKDIKLSERIRVPGNILRGFENGKVGPKDGDDFIGGNYMTAINFTTTLPQILPNSQNTDIVLFFDAANIWGVDYDSSLDDNKVKSSIGVGLDWFSPVGPMNFSFAQPLTKSSSDVTETFRFNLGTTF